jgi:hypothetical protein
MAYIGGKAWFLATMVAPNQKELKLFLPCFGHTFKTNNKVLDPLIESNVHYSPWSRTSLVQKVSAGGLNAQSYEFRLKAVYTRWIFKLLAPRHVASWKSLPFHFLRDVIPGLGDYGHLVR